MTEFYGEGLTEYEWDWALSPDRVHVLLDPLGVARDATLEEIGRRVRQLDRTKLQRGFEEAGARFWSRIGD